MSMCNYDNGFFKVIMISILNVVKYEWVCEWVSMDCRSWMGDWLGVF